MPIEYPKKFDLCPNCGSMVRIIESETREEASKRKGAVGTEAKTGCLITQSPIFDPTKAAIIAPKKISIIMARYDICADCGTLYCVEVQKSEGSASPQTRRDDFRHRP